MKKKVKKKKKKGIKCPDWPVLKIKQETDEEQCIPQHGDCVKNKSKHSEDGSKSAEQVEVKQESLKHKKISQKEAYTESPETEQGEEKQGSSKHKKISHREVITESPQTEQVDGKEGSKHKKNLIKNPSLNLSSLNK